MKRRMLFWAILPILVLALAGVAQAWQGRMAGFCGPYGLLADESDFLIHPAKIANGDGVRFYGYYRFTYTDVDSDVDSIYEDDWFEFSGDEYGHDALVGAAFPLGPGRMGLFFEYAGRQGDYDGSFEGGDLSTELSEDLDNFSGRILYALPVGSVKLGAEAQLAYRQEEKEYSMYDPTVVGRYALNPAYWGMWSWDLYDFLPLNNFFPYDSSYWEVLLKGSAEFAIGPADIEFALRGGFLFGGDNTWESEYPYYDFRIYEELKGDVGGWRLGGDVWVRVPVGGGLSLPFLVRVDYGEKTRDGDYSFYYSTWESTHELTEKRLDLLAGGGLDMEIGAGTRIAAGIYYNYLQNKDRRTYARDMEEIFWEDEDYYTDFDFPITEHRLVLRFAGEHELSPMFTLRAGLNFFYGWPQGDITYRWEEILWWAPYQWSEIYEISADGSHWGIGGSLGASIRVIPGLTFEPFFKGGWQQLKLHGDGTEYDYEDFDPIPVDTDPFEGDLTRTEWYISGGLAILFDL